MKRQVIAEYLGTTTNATVDPTKEINRRIVLARVAEEKLKTFWREGNITRRWKLITYQSIVLTKLLYELEALPINDNWQRKLDAFNVRGLRRIWNIPSTYVNREPWGKSIQQSAKEEGRNRRQSRHTAILYLQ